MTLSLLWIDLYFNEGLYGFGLISIKGEERSRSLLGLYWCCGEIMVDLFWIRFKE